MDRFYYLDWLAMSLSLIAVWLLGNKSRWGFACFILANTLWLFVGWLVGSYGIMVGNSAFLVMNARGFFRWNAGATADKASNSDAVRGCP